MTVGWDTTGLVAWNRAVARGAEGIRVSTWTAKGCLRGWLSCSPFTFVEKVLALRMLPTVMLMSFGPFGVWVHPSRAGTTRLGLLDLTVHIKVQPTTSPFARCRWARRTCSSRMVDRNRINALEMSMDERVEMLLMKFWSM